jgi:hypothetical protein
MVDTRTGKSFGSRKVEEMFSGGGFESDCRDPGSEDNFCESLEESAQRN